MTHTKSKLSQTFYYIKSNGTLYLLLLPGLLFLIIYKFLPLYGITIAFKDYNIFAGSDPMEAIRLSPWVGLEHFERLFASKDFIKVLTNTLLINSYKIIFLFPLPIIAAIMLNEIKNRTFKKTAQTFIYIPYFFSWVVVFGIFYSFLGNYGMVNQILAYIGIKPISFFSNPGIFRGLLVVTEGWKEIGWNTVIYLAAITSIDPTLYEAAKVDGASKLKQIFHVTLPGLMPTIVLMLIMKVGYILDTGFEQILVMYNPTVYDVADIIQTYVYRIGIGQMNYSLATALGMFNAVIAFILIISANSVSKKMLGRSIW